ncbi:cation-transporting P-type ATPase [Azospirillum sp. RWY-5-1]|uniref:Cation-transporting P-type ATPase n=1 Tax=Azospirillum oleiclasticum TaxID=2735135 RepID=A0ABX2TEC0_9PROT|nr:cation-transporting P-type ATPase [Azospirillum oleiclasticum]NYZ14879.1 cation-transporting P-type ATPase [Azospirillum oleiclasticum]NYZ22135.1 cation-transporting P-type ATPase [Azospirillum oleiclasticum]
MRIQTLSPEQVLAGLRSGGHGLTTREAARRLGRFGANTLKAPRREPMAVRLLRSFTHFFALLLWLAAALAAVAEIRQPGEGMGLLAIAVVAVILVNGLFSFAQDYRAERELAALAKLLPQRVKTWRDGQVSEVEAAALVPGDVIVLTAGDRVPADARLLSATGVRLDASTLTGESVPVLRTADPCTEHEAPMAGNLVFAGTSVVAGEGTALVYATGNHTEFGRIANLTQGEQRERWPLLGEIAALSRLIAVLAVGLGAVFFAIGVHAGQPVMAAFVFAIGIIVANVPEGLLPTVTLALAMAARRMARRNVLVRHLPAVEALGSATVICTDKTGTLTLNRMTVRATDGEPGAIAAVERHCHTLARSKTGWLGDPMEVALVEHAGPGPVHARTGEVPFDTERRRLSTLHRAPTGPVVYTKGAAETVLPLCTARATAAGVVPLDDTGRAAVLAAQDAMADRGLRVLALAWRDDPDPADPERGLVLAGLVGLEDPPRPEVPDAVAKARAAGIRVVMVTGDHPHTALAIAREIGLVRGSDPELVTGDALRTMTDSHLMLVLDGDEVVFARVGADQKLRIVQALQRRGETVAVTGDGVNDAPALKQGDIGVAMGRCGTDVAREAADMILLDDNFASIVHAVEEGRAVFANIRRFMTYIFTSNIPEIVPFLAFILLGIPLPLTVVQILAVDLGTDLLPALALGAEPPHPGVMIRPPRPRRERLLTWGLLARAYLFLGPFEAAAAMGAFFVVLGDGGWRWGDHLAAGDPLHRLATTACLAGIVVAQVANLLLCRADRESILDRSMPRNPLIGWAIIAELLIIAAIVYTPPGNLLFATAPLPWWAWLTPLPAVMAMVVVEEARKALARSLPCVKPSALRAPTL